MRMIEKGMSIYDSSGRLHLRQQGDTRSFCGKHMIGLQWEPIRGGKLPKNKPPILCCRCWRSIKRIEGERQS